MSQPKPEPHIFVFGFRSVTGDRYCAVCDLEHAECVNEHAPPCRWYVSIAQPECGEPAVRTVKVKTKVVTAEVDLCRQHAARHDQAFADIRTARAEAAAQEAQR